MIKKIVSGVAAVACFVWLTAAAAGFITWGSFWIGMILFAGLAYVVLPQVKE